MNKYDYNTIDVKPEDLDKELEFQGSHGWELKQLIVMQKQKPSFKMGVQSFEVEIQFKLIFFKCQE